MTLLQFLACFVAYGAAMLGSCALMAGLGGWVGGALWMLSAAAAHFCLFGGQ